MTKPRIAVLDQDPVAREELRLMLQMKTEVDVFSTADEFQQSIDLASYDCLLVESSVARKLHLWLFQAGFALPLIYLSSQPSISDATAAIKLGAVDYLKKPAAAGEVFTALDAAMRQRRTGVPDRHFRVGIALDLMVNALERELISVALQRSRGVVGGPRGAAAMLGVTRTGLLYKMKKLGVSRALVASSPQDTTEDESPAQPSSRISSSTTT